MHSTAIVVESQPTQKATKKRRYVHSPMLQIGKLHYLTVHLPHLEDS